MALRTNICKYYYTFLLFALQMLALHDIHERGYIHRDIKMTNILFTELNIDGLWTPRLGICDTGAGLKIDQIPNSPYRDLDIGADDLRPLGNRNNRIADLRMAINVGLLMMTGEKTWFMTPPPKQALETKVRL